MEDLALPGGSDPGRCWRCGSEVEKKALKQWFFKITDYADELLEATDALDWTDTVKLAQKNWIGKSQGAEIDFELVFDDEKLNENRGPNGEKAHLTVAHFATLIEVPKMAEENRLPRFAILIDADKGGL